MISFIIDLSTQMESFLEEDCTIGEIVYDYYLPFIPWINGLLFPLYALISVIFFTSRMAYDSEIISILNAGVSFRRMMRPYFIGACIIGGLHLFANHYLIPLGNKSKVNFEHTYLYKGEDKGRTRDVHLILNRDTANQSITKAYVKTYARIDTSVRNLILDNMFHDDFVLYENDKLTMTTPELQRAINREKARGVKTTKGFLLEIQRRSAEPFTIIIVTLIGMAIAARKVRGGLGLHLALGVALGAAYVFLSRFSTTFATNQTLTPELAVWIPNILFTLILIYLISKAQK